MKNKFVIALTVFTLVFCSPVIIAKSIEAYGHLGAKLGQTLYEALNEDN